MSTASPVRITVELPAEAAGPGAADTKQLAHELRLLWILEQVRTGAISVGRAAQLAGVDRWRFLKIMSEHGQAAISYSPTELDSELEILRSQ